MSIDLDQSSISFQYRISCSSVSQKTRMLCLCVFKSHGLKVSSVKSRQIYIIIYSHCNTTWHIRHTEKPVLTTFRIFYSLRSGSRSILSLVSMERSELPYTNLSPGKMYVIICVQSEPKSLISLIFSYNAPNLNVPHNLNIRHLRWTYFLYIFICNRNAIGESLLIYNSIFSNFLPENVENTGCC